MFSVGTNSVSRLLKAIDVDCIATISSSMLWRCRI